tara:strand:- start:107 stop:697 length:591 start_codon:yes stop_codon:yes gene_type:complete
MQMLLKKESCLQTIKGSRFIALAYPVSSHETAKEILEDIKIQHPKANHHCFAWRLANGEERMSDDGEPRGSAGAPILKRLISKNCVQTMVVVIRYFGGTKLGIGGLIRAYGGVAQEVLEQSTFTPFEERMIVAFSYEYSDSNTVSYVLSLIENAIENQVFTDKVALEVSIKKQDYEELIERLYSESSGRIQAVVLK